MSDDNDVDEVTVPFKKTVVVSELSLSQCNPSFSELLITVEIMNQQLFILQQAVSTLLAFSTEQARQAGLQALTKSGSNYESAFDFWPSNVVRPQISEVIKIYKALFKVRI